MRAPFHILKTAHKAICIAISTAFIASSFNIPIYAQEVMPAQMPWMPKPGVRIDLSPEFTPAHLKGMVIHPDNALQFDFIIHHGDSPLSGDQKQTEYKKLIKYFLASLAIPDENQWVNLSPYEKDRIIQDDFGKTEMGRDLLAQDYILKQITASLIYPESNLGQKFWDKVYAQAYQQYGVTNIPVNTFNKVWIMPDEAYIYEQGNTVYIVKQRLKVMLEEDYLSLSKHSGITSAPPIKEGKEVNKIGSQVVRQIVLPALEKEVNEGKNFAQLRQVYSGMLLAAWYKRSLKESLLGKIYANKAKVKGVDQQDSKTNEAIYQQYLKAFKKGVFNYIKEDIDKYSKESIPRKYFSGGAEGLITRDGVDLFPQLVKEADRGMVGNDLATVGGRLDSVFTGFDEDIVEVTSIDHALKTTAEKQTVLVIESEETLLETHKNLLQMKGLNVLTAQTPDEAKKLWESNKDKINLIISDTNHPIGSWIEIVRSFVQEKKVPVIGTSAAESSMDDWKGVAVVFISQPFNIRDYISTLYQVLPPPVVKTFTSKSNVQVKAIRANKWMDGKPIKNPTENVKGVILLIDDDQDQLDVTELYLTMEGFAVLSAHTVEQAKELVTLNEEKITIIVSDTNNGSTLWVDDVTEIAERIKAPIIAVSGLEGPKAWKDLNKAFVSKPFNAAQLIEAISQVKVEELATALFSARSREGQTAEWRPIKDFDWQNGSINGQLIKEIDFDQLTTKQIAKELMISSVAGMVYKRSKDGMLLWTVKDNANEMYFNIRNPAALPFKIIPSIIQAEFLDMARETLDAGMVTKDNFEKNITRYLKSLGIKVEIGNNLERFNDTGFSVIDSGTEAIPSLTIIFYSNFDSFSEQWRHLKAEVEQRIKKFSHTQLDTKDDQWRAVWGISPKIRTHAVQEGESLRQIAKQYGITFNSIMDMNHVTFGEDKKLQAGQVLIIPQVQVSTQTAVVEKTTNLTTNISTEDTNTPLKPVSLRDYPRRPLRDRMSVPGIVRKFTLLGILAIGLVRTSPSQMIASATKGGIDFNAANVNLQIRRDGKGVPLPMAQQDLEHININGLIPVIISIKPATSLPVFSELQNTSTSVNS